MMDEDNKEQKEGILGCPPFSLTDTYHTSGLGGGFFLFFDFGLV